MTFGEGLDDHHGCTATGTRAGVLGWGVLCDILSGEDGHGNERGQRSGEQLPGPCEVLDPGGVSQQAVVADAVESAREDMQQEAAHELIDREGHRFVAATALGAVVLELEGDALFIECDQPAVGDGHAVGVARQIGEHRLRSGEGALGIDHPVDLLQRLQ